MWLSEYAQNLGIKTKALNLCAQPTKKKKMKLTSTVYKGILGYDKGKVWL